MDDAHSGLEKGFVGGNHRIFFSSAHKSMDHSETGAGALDDGWDMKDKSEMGIKGDSWNALRQRKVQA